MTFWWASRASAQGGAEQARVELVGPGRVKAQALKIGVGRVDQEVELRGDDHRGHPQHGALLAQDPLGAKVLECAQSVDPSPALGELVGEDRAYGKVFGDVEADGHATI